MSELQGELDRLERLLAETIALTVPRVHEGSNSTVTINAGGAGVWVAVTCCIVSFVMNIGLAVALLIQSREVAGLRDYVTATYMMAPQLQEIAKRIK